MPTRIRSAFCHELTHVSAARLALAVWLNEGLAMVTQEAFLGRPLVRPDSLAFVKNRMPKQGPMTYTRLSDEKDADSIAYAYARAYWITRYLREAHPQLLRDILSRRRRTSNIEALVAEGLAIPRAELWQRIDGMVAEHFEKRQVAG